MKLVVSNFLLVAKNSASRWVLEGRGLLSSPIPQPSLLSALL